MLCQKCGQKLEDNAKFCRFCGSKVEIVNEPESIQEEKNLVHEIENRIIETDAVQEIQRQKKGDTEKTVSKRIARKIILVGTSIVAIVVLCSIIVLNFKNKTEGEVSEPINSEPIIEETLVPIETTYPDSFSEESSEQKSLKITISQKENETTVNTDNETIPLQETTPIANEDDQIEKVEIQDTDDIHVEYWGIKKWSETNWVVNLYVENNRTEDIDFILSNFRINDFTMDIGNNGAVVPAGSKFLSGPDFNCVISVDELGQYGITSITELDFDLVVKDEATNDTISISEVHLEMNEPINNGFGVTELSKGEVLLNQDNIYVGCRGLDENSYEDTYILDLYIENNTDNTAYIALEKARINGFVIDIGNSHIGIPSGGKHLTVPNYDMVIHSDTLEEYEITSIETLDFSLIIEDEMFGDAIYETNIHIDVT